MIRTHLAVNCKNYDAKGVTKPTLASTGLDLYVRQGVPGLYKGLCASLIGITPYVGVKMAVFDIVHSKVKLEKNSAYYLGVNLLLGGFVGGFSVLITYPLEVIRRRMMLRGFEGYENYSSFIDCATKLGRREGMKGFYRGIIPC